jgi:hypothetical protein
MDIRGLARALDAVLRIAITLMCVAGTFIVARYAVSVVFR